MLLQRRAHIDVLVMSSDGCAAHGSCARSSATIATLHAARSVQAFRASSIDQDLDSGTLTSSLFEGVPGNTVASEPLVSCCCAGARNGSTASWVTAQSPSRATIVSNRCLLLPCDKMLHKVRVQMLSDLRMCERCKCKMQRACRQGVLCSVARPSTSPAYSNDLSALYNARPARPSRGAALDMLCDRLRGRLPHAITTGLGRARLPLKPPCRGLITQAVQPNMGVIELTSLPLLAHRI